MKKLLQKIKSSKLLRKSLIVLVLVCVLVSTMAIPSFAADDTSAQAVDPEAPVLYPYYFNGTYHLDSGVFGDVSNTGKIREVYLKGTITISGHTGSVLWIYRGVDSLIIILQTSNGPMEVTNNFYILSEYRDWSFDLTGLQGSSEDIAWAFEMFAAWFPGFADPYRIQAPYFEFNDTRYFFQPGLTWSDFKHSRYNLVSGREIFYIISNNVIQVSSGLFLNTNADGYVLPGVTYQALNLSSLDFNFSPINIKILGSGDGTNDQGYPFNTQIFAYSNSFDPGDWIYASVTSSDDGTLYRNVLSSNELNSHVSFFTYNEQVNIPYIDITIKSSFPQIFINGQGRSGTMVGQVQSVNKIDWIFVKPNALTFDFSISGYDPEVTYSYRCRVVLTQVFDYDDVYERGFNSGVRSEDARLYWYNDIFAEGFEVGLNSSDSENLAQNLLGDTLSAPIKALNDFVIITTPSGNTISLGLVLSGAIALSIFLAFLKIFAGG